MIQKIKNILKPQPKFDPLTDIYDWHPLKDEYNSFKSIIINHLDKRDEMDIDERLEVHPDYPFTQMWVYRMCEELEKEIDREDVTVDDIIKLDTYCGGHIDYLKKFSLRLAELKSNEPKSKIYDL